MCIKDTAQVFGSQDQKMLNYFVERNYKLFYYSINHNNYYCIMKNNMIDNFKDYIKLRIVKTRRFLRRSKYTKLFGKTIFQYDLWHFSLRSVTLGAGVGTFIAFTPTYGIQIPLSILAAMFFKLNLPITLLMLLFTNPFSVPIIYYYQTKLGMFLLGSDIEIKLTTIRTLADAISFLIKYSIPLWLGSMIVSTLLGSISYLSTLIMYKFLSENIPHHKPYIKKTDDIYIDDLENL